MNGNVPIYILQLKLQFIAKINNSFKSFARTFWDCNALIYAGCFLFEIRMSITKIIMICREGRLQRYHTSKFNNAANQIHFC